jgi:hypothetical protein
LERRQDFLEASRDRFRLRLHQITGGSSRVGLPRGAHCNRRFAGVRSSAHLQPSISDPVGPPDFQVPPLAHKGAGRLTPNRPIAKEGAVRSKSQWILYKPQTTN